MRNGWLKTPSSSHSRATIEDYLMAGAWLTLIPALALSRGLLVGVQLALESSRVLFGQPSKPKKP